MDNITFIWLVFGWLVCLILARFSFHSRVSSIPLLFHMDKESHSYLLSTLKAIEINEERNLILSMHLGFVNVFKYNKLNVKRIRVDTSISHGRAFESSKLLG